VEKENSSVSPKVWVILDAQDFFDFEIINIFINAFQVSAFFKVVVASTVFIMPPSVLLLPIDPG
jgi:hypothetical protein